MKLADAALLRDQAFIDGAWVGADNGKGFPVTNPADGSALGNVPDMGEAETKRAIAAADAAATPGSGVSVHATGAGGDPARAAA